MLAVPRPCWRAALPTGCWETSETASNSATGDSRKDWGDGVCAGSISVLCVQIGCTVAEPGAAPHRRCTCRPAARHQALAITRSAWEHAPGGCRACHGGWGGSPRRGGGGCWGERESEERERAERGALQLVRVQLPALRGSCHCQCLQPSCLLPGLAASSGRVPCCFQAAVGLSGALLCLLPSRIPARCDLRSTLLPACSPVCDFLATAVH